MDSESSLDQPESGELPEIVPSDYRRTRMDMKQQLVLWKKASYLLDHISLSQPFLEKLVDYDLFTREMTDQIHAKGYNVERTLVMLSLLGQHGDDVYNKFIQILMETHHYTVVKELKKTEKFTHYGEMLPPVFTYFLDLSEFLRMYPHIAIKLGEDEKHILQSFIEGKIDMATRKVNESNKILEDKITRLKKKITHLQQEIRKRDEQLSLLEDRLNQSRLEIVNLNTRIGELEEMNFALKCEIRSLKHFRDEQEELENWIQQERKEKRIKDSPIGMFGRLPTFVGNKKAKNTTSVKLKLLSAQVHMAVNKMYYTQGHIENLNYLERRLNSFIGKPRDAFDRETIQDLHNLKRLLMDTQKEKKLIKNVLTEEEKEVMAKEEEIERLKQEVLGKSKTGDYQLEDHSSLRTKMIQLLDDIAKLHQLRIDEINVRHFKELNTMREHISEITYAHNKEKEALKWRMRVKMGELHRREMLHRRMKHLIMVLCRYHAKNLNATVTVEEARKVVRGIIGEARKLRKMVDKAEMLEKNPGGVVLPPTEEEQEKERLERERLEREREEKEEMKAGKQRKKKRRKDVDYLKNERLMFLADRLQEDWRTLGLNLGLSMNRMDMVEIELPPDAKPDTLGYAMLKAWRDEVKGKVSIKAARLVKSLLKMGRKDLAIIVLPLHRVELLQSEAEEELKKEEEQAKIAEEDEEEEEEEDDVDHAIKEVDVVSQMARNVLGMETRNDSVPVLPEVTSPQGIST